MNLITDSLTEKLLANGRAQRAAVDNDQPALNFKPIVKLFSPMRNALGCSPNSIPTTVSPFAYAISGLAVQNWETSL